MAEMNFMALVDGKMPLLECGLNRVTVTLRLIIESWQNTLVKQLWK